MGLREFAQRTVAGAVDRAVRVGQGLAARLGMTSPPVQNTERAKRLDRFDRLYWGRHYEQSGLSESWAKAPVGGRRVPLRQRKPAVQYDLPRLIVDRPTAMLFGEGRFPEIAFQPANPPPKGTAGEKAFHEQSLAVTKWLADVADEGALAHQCLLWARQGARLGSAVLTWAAVEGEFQFQAHLAKYCTPTFHPKKRDELIELELRYRFKRAVPQYDEVSRVQTVREVEFWYREVWDTTTHTVFEPVPVGDGSEPKWTPAADGVTAHEFGFVPAVWCKNLDDGDPGSFDGLSLLDGLADVVEDIDRTLSQKSRAIFYNQEPDRVYQGLTEAEQKKVEVAGGGGTTAIPKDAKVTLLELQGDGQRVAEEHILSQRGRALEVSRVTVPDPDKLLAAAKSGAALRILHAPTIELVGELRQTYGRALRALLNQILRAARDGKLPVLVTQAPPEMPSGRVTLQWGRLFDPSLEDIQAAATSAASLKASALVDTESLTRWICGLLGIRDVHAVHERLEQEVSEGYGGMPGQPVPPSGAPEKDDASEDDPADE